MKNLFYKILMPVALIAVSLTGCKDDDEVAPLPETVPLSMSLNNRSFVMGDEVVLTFEVEGRGLTLNEDVKVYLTAKSGDTDYSSVVFTDFPSVITLPKGEYIFSKAMHIVNDGSITSDITFDLSAFARGYTVSGASQSILVSDYYRTVMSIRNNADRTMNEGSKFILVATVGEAVKEAVEVTVNTDMPGEFDATFPMTLTIPAGEKTVETEITTTATANTDTGTRTPKLSFTTTSASYPLLESEMTLTIKDLDKPLNANKALDERWLYPDPDRAYASSDARILKLAASGVSNTVKMSRGDVHPGAEADRSPELSKWKFYSAVEFHYLPDDRMYTTKSSWNISQATNVLFPRFFGDQYTGAIQTAPAVDNAACTQLNEEGYFRMTTLYHKDATFNSAGEGQSSDFPGTTKNYITSAVYMSKFKKENSAASYTHAPQWIRIYPGMRVETRARYRGVNKVGMLPGIWLQGNAALSGDPTWNVWPQYGEIDVLEVNDYSTGAGHGVPNYAEQTFHVGVDKVSHQNPTKATALGEEMENWNIYWMEWVDNSTVRMGINGETRITLTQADVESKGAKWPFNTTVNDEGLHYLLTMMYLKLGNSFWNNGTWDTELRKISYAQSMQNDTKCPRLEVDWIRFYTNVDPDTYDANMPIKGKWSENTLFY